MAVHPHGMTPDKASANEGDHVARGIRLRDRRGVSAIVLGIGANPIRLAGCMQTFREPP